jgi:NAD(P)-dependent dehydrogenase (short-subunit alcohol dehydrogenase family)
LTGLFHGLLLYQAIQKEMNENIKKLVGKVALVTGGSRGLGAEIARALADEGADVAISYAASEQKAQAVTRDIETRGVRTAAFQADQGVPAQPEGLIQAVVSQFGGLDILVNNAAVSIPGLVGSPKTDAVAMDRQWAVNALGVIATIRAAAKVMRNGGRIISVGSGVATRVGTEGLADYAGSKAAVVGYSKGAARDLASRNITVNVVQAGLMDTDMAAPYAAKMDAMMSTLTIKRYARLEEIAAAVVFLASPEASYITGAVLDAEGGYGA